MPTHTTPDIAHDLRMTARRHLRRAAELGRQSRLEGLSPEVASRVAALARRHRIKGVRALQSLARRKLVAGL